MLVVTSQGARWCPWCHLLIPSVAKEERSCVRSEAEQAARDEWIKRNLIPTRKELPALFGVALKAVCVYGAVCLLLRMLGAK